jgi:hypothetical protein
MKGADRVLGVWRTASAELLFDAGTTCKARQGKARQGKARQGKVTGAARKARPSVLLGVASAPLWPGLFVDYR